MRELVLKMSMSLDGFVADADGRGDWMFGSDPEPRAWSVAMLETAGLHVMGSRTFRAMAAHWPDATGPFAAPMNAIPKLVFSRRGISPAAEAPAGGSWAEARVASGDLAGEVAALKATGGGPIVAHGGAAFARSLVAGGLVDRFVLLVVPVALGRGLPLFADLPVPLRLRLESARAFPGGAVAQVYRPA